MRQVGNDPIRGSLSTLRFASLISKSGIGLLSERLPGFHCTDPRESFWKLWDSINGEGNSWGNPWVWALSVRVHRQNIDQFVKAAA